MAQWSFRRRQIECASCGRPFQDGERHPSTLLFHEGELLREDFCEPCFRERGDVDLDAEGEAGPVASAPPSEILFWWFTHHQEELRKATLRLDMEALEALFLRLAEFDADSARELRYLLCLLLMRKRRLKLDKVRRDPEGEALVVRRPRRQEEQVVYVFDFTPERIEVVRGRLQEIFEGVDGDDGFDLTSLVDPRSRPSTVPVADGADGACGADGEGAVEPDETAAGTDESAATSAGEAGAEAAGEVGAEASDAVGAETSDAAGAERS